MPGTSLVAKVTLANRIDRLFIFWITDSSGFVGGDGQTKQCQVVRSAVQSIFPQ